MTFNWFIWRCVKCIKSTKSEINKSFTTTTIDNNIINLLFSLRLNSTLWFLRILGIWYTSLGSHWLNLDLLDLLIKLGQDIARIDIFILCAITIVNKCVVCIFLCVIRIITIRFENWDLLILVRKLQILYLVWNNILMVLLILLYKLLILLVNAFIWCIRFLLLLMIVGFIVHIGSCVQFRSHKLFYNATRLVTIISMSWKKEYIIITIWVNLIIQLLHCA
jgi:hypothetical protein